MLAVNVGVGHQHDLVVPQLGDVELVVDARAQGRDNRLDFSVLQNPVDAGLFDVDDLAAQRQDRLEHRVATTLGRAAGRVALHHIQFRFRRVCRTAVGQLARQPADIGGAFAAHQFACLARGDACLRRRNRLIHNRFSICGVRVEPVLQLLVAYLLHKRLDLGVAELGLGLAFKLWLTDLHRDDRRQPFANVIAGEVRILLLKELLLLGVFVDHRGQRRTETFFVSAALMGVDGVGKGVHRFGIAGIPLHRDLYLMAFALAGEIDDRGVDG